MKNGTELFESRLVRGEFKPAANSTDHTGKRYGRLTVVKCVGIYVISDKQGKEKKRRVWLCLCDCGEEIETIGNRLTNKMKNSCGCQKSEATMKFNQDTKRKEIGDSTKLQQYLSAKHGSIKRGYEFKLSFDEFVKLSESDCYYCGAKPSQKIRHGHYSKWIKNGLDRVDNKNGYTTDNCVPSCKYCNWMKHSLNQNDFIYKCILIAKRFKGVAHSGEYKSCDMLNGGKGPC